MDRRSVGILVLLAPQLWLLHRVLGAVFPNVLLGRWYTAILDAALGLAIVLCAAWLVGRPGSERWRRPGWRRSVLVAVIAGGWLLVPAALLVAQFSLGTPMRYPGDCEPWPPLAAKTCEGRDFSVMQGRYSYRRVRGGVRGPTCETLRSASKPESPTDPATECRLEDLEGWRSRSCAPYGLPPGWSCYVCEWTTAGFDTYRKLQAYDPDCSEGVGYATTTEELERVPSKLDGFSSVGSSWR